MSAKKKLLTFTIPDDITRDLPFIPKSPKDLETRVQPTTTSKKDTGNKKDTSNKDDTGINKRGILTPNPVLSSNNISLQATFLKTLDEKLTKSEMSIYFFLINRTSGNNSLETGIIGSTEIAQAVKVTLLTVKRSMRKLKQEKLLLVKEQFNTSNKKGSIYKITLPQTQEPKQND